MDVERFLNRGLKKNQIKRELRTKGIILLKAASVIGEEFSTNALIKIHPLKGESHSSIS
jgi:hypothetical protein